MPCNYFDTMRISCESISYCQNRAQLRQWQERRSRQLPALPVLFLVLFHVLFLVLFHVNVECSCLVNHAQTNNYKQSLPEQRFA